MRRKLFATLLLLATLGVSLTLSAQTAIGEINGTVSESSLGSAHCTTRWAANQLE